MYAFASCLPAVLTTRGGVGFNSSPAGILISGTAITTGEGPVGLSIPGGIFNGSTSAASRYSGFWLLKELHPERIAIITKAIAIRYKEIIIFF
jgi:hypothetical protein